MSLLASLQRLLQAHDPWEGTSEELLVALEVSVDTRVLGRSLKSNREALAEAGIYLESYLAGQGVERKRWLRVTSQSTDQCQTFFETLYGDNPAGHLIIWSKQGEDKRTASFVSPETCRKAAKFARGQDQLGYDVYFGLGLQEQAPSKGRRGVEAEVCCVPGVWLDLDLAGEGHATSSNKTHCPDIASAQQLIARFPLPPTFAVHSGGGLHLYWAFQEPWVIDDDLRPVAKALVSDFQAVFRLAEVNPEGWAVDSTMDLSRVLRVPLTHNYKSATPRPVRFVGWHPERRYDHVQVREAIATFKPTDTPKTTVKATPIPQPALSTNGKTSPPPTSLADYTKEEVLARAQAHLSHADPATPGNRSHNAFRLAAVLRNDFAFDRFGLEPEGLALLHGWNQAKNADPLPPEKIEICWRDGHRYAKQPEGCKLFERAPRSETRNAPESNSPPADPAAAIATPGIPLQRTLTLPAAYPTLFGPDGWQVKPDGLWAYNAKAERWERRLLTPLLITGRLKSAENGDELADLSWPSRQGWQTHTFECGDIGDGATIAKRLAAKGYHAHTGLGRSIADYLVKFLKLNEVNLFPHLTASSFGWKKEKDSEVVLGFLLGDTLEGADCSQAVRFHGGEGMGSLERGMTQRGSWEGWKQAFNMVTAHPRPLLCMYASFAAPLLDVLKANSFVVDLCGETSRGKTSTLRAVASVWGNPDASDSDSIIQSWNTTQIAVERHCGAMRHLPILLDDTKPVPDKSMVSRVVYMIANNQNKGRGTPKGIQERKSWRTIAISTGESRIRQMSRESGKNTRLVTLWGDAFEGQAAAKDVAAIRKSIQNNFGVAGRMWVRWLHQHRGMWANWCEQFAVIRQHYSDLGQNAPEVDRLAEYLASLEMARQLVHECFPDLLKVPSPLCHLWESIFNEVRESDSPSEALRVVYDWCSSNRLKFYTKHSSSQSCPPSGWAGRWDFRGDLCLYQHTLDEILKKAGFDPAEMRQRWADRDWIECDTSCGARCTTVRVRVDYQRARLIVCKREILEQVCGAEDIAQ